MARRQITVIDVVAVFSIGLVCLPILMALMPYVEQSRTEARISKAYHDVRRLHESAVAGIPAPTITLPDRDPWGQPYRLVPLNGGHVRVLSSGPNMSSPATGTDDDDIYSDMPASPMKAIIARKNRQWLVALGVTAGTWVFLASLYMRYRRPPFS